MFRQEHLVSRKVIERICVPKECRGLTKICFYPPDALTGVWQYTRKIRERTISRSMAMSPLMFAKDLFNPELKIENQKPLQDGFNYSL
jgi:hypothetical protein